MTYYIENETKVTFPFSVEEIVGSVMETVLKMENCPYEATVNVLLTDNEGIREFNKNYRDIDVATDVLSFPNISYESPGAFDMIEDEQPDCFDLDSGELVLGDIIISVDKAQEQAESYGHSQRREFAFLMAHSLFHLCGYDHMSEEEAAIMEEKQEKVLKTLNITRES